jgi:hypothetical protein
MAQSIVPYRTRGLDDAKSMLIEGRLERVKATFTSAGVENFLHPLLLNEKMIRMEL